jgi:hypothetical protein
MQNFMTAEIPPKYLTLEQMEEGSWELKDGIPL